MLITVATTVALLQLAVADHARGAHRHHRVAVHDLALLVDHDHAVGVAVEGDADRGAALLHLRARRSRDAARPQSRLMLVPFGRTPIAVTLGAQLLEAPAGATR